MKIEVRATLTDVFVGLRNHLGAENTAHFAIPSGSRVVVPISHQEADQLSRELGRSGPRNESGDIQYRR
jgi:hypothetical protein